MYTGEPVQLWEILVPCMRNDNKPYRTRHHREWDQQILKIAGGLTVMHPTTKGMWTSRKEWPVIEPMYSYYGQPFYVHTDRMIPVRIACTSEQMDEIIRRTLIHYPDQQAIMAYVISEEVRIVHRD